MIFAQRKSGLFTEANITAVSRNVRYVANIEEAARRLSINGLLTGEAGQRNFNRLIQYAPALDTINQKLRETFSGSINVFGPSSQTLFDMIINETIEEHNAQRVASVVSFFRANQDNALKRSVLPLVDMISGFTGTKARRRDL